MARVVHFEIPVDDSDRAKTFYAEVFGWKIEGYGDERYWLATTGEEGEAGIDGALIGRGDIHTNPVLIIGVESLDAAIEAATVRGATLLQGRLEIPGIGWSAYVTDPEGNTIGLFEPASG